MATMRAFLLVSALSCAMAQPSLAQDGSNVLVVINEESSQSRQVGAEYMAARRIPPGNVVRIRTAVSETIQRNRYEYEIELPILRWITGAAAQDRLLYIVLTKDMPLRIAGTSGPRGSVASVDSELTLLYQRLLGNRILPAGRLPNPYYLADRPMTEARAFSHASHGMYLVTRLDGFTVADVSGLIVRGAAPSRQGLFILDQRAGLRDSGGDAWLNMTAERLSATPLKDRVVLDTSKTVVTGRQPVLGYYSWGSNDPSITRRRFKLGFVPGALAGMFVSTDARTFQEPPETWNVGIWGDMRTFFAGSPQSLVGDLIREGVTGVAGHVAEPYLDSTVRPQILFPAYVAGFNLAESYYLAMPHLSWQNIVVGDPLCAPWTGPRPAPEEIDPPLDPETELPRFFSTRRLGVLEGFGVKPQVARLVLKASAQLSRGDLLSARPSLEEVTRLEPHMNAAHFVLAGIYEASGEHDRAIERYRTIIVTAPEEVRSLNNLAYSLAVNKKMLDEALVFAEKAYRIAYETNAQVELDLGASLIAGKGTPVGSLPFGIDAYDLFSMKAQIADTLGWIHHLKGDSATAETYIQEAAKGAPYSAEVQLHLATVTAALGRPAEALDALKKALALDKTLPARPDVQKLRARLMSP
jgi:uncharacterized protein (TIGR03790 family)